jgi:hypothetical protein
VGSPGSIVRATILRSFGHAEQPGPRRRCADFSATYRWNRRRCVYWKILGLALGTVAQSKEWSVTLSGPVDSGGTYLAEARASFSGRTDVRWRFAPTAPAARRTCSIARPATRSSESDHWKQQLGILCRDDPRRHDAGTALFESPWPAPGRQSRHGRTASRDANARRWTSLAQVRPAGGPRCCRQRRADDTAIARRWHRNDAGDGLSTGTAP